MNRKKILISLISIVVISLAIVSLYNTYATSTGLNVNDNTYTFTLKNSTEEVSLAAGETKTVIYQIKNTNSGTVKYGVGYSGTNIVVKVYEDSDDPATGIIYKGENKFVKLYIKNSGTSSSTCTLSSVLGYENGGNLVVPSGTTLVTEVYYSSPESFIRGLFTKTGIVTEDPEGDAIVLDVDTTNSLIKDPRGNIRYYGSNPNNYIKFNCAAYPVTGCETWRIIGVVDGKVKLMRGSQIGKFSWDTSVSTINNGNGINQWGESSGGEKIFTYAGADLMKLLNPGYETNRDSNASGALITVNNSLYYTSGSGTCYNGRSNASTTTGCNFTSSGVQGIKNDATRNKIAETTFYTGGWDSSSIYPNVIIDKERGTTVISNPSDGITRTTSWLGRVAVPYPSDYGYAVDLSKCTGKNLDQYYYSTCTANNWMKNIITNNGSNVGWLLTPYSDDVRRAWYVYSSGGVDNVYTAYVANGVAPVLYLSSEAIIESGSGTEGNPYTLAA